MGDEIWKQLKEEWRGIVKHEKLPIVVESKRAPATASPESDGQEPAATNANVEQIEYVDIGELSQDLRDKLIKFCKNLINRQW